MANYSQGRQFNREESYVYGNTARDLEVMNALEAPATGEPLRELKARRKDERRSHISFGYILFLTVTMLAVGYSLISYLMLQAEIASMNENISVYEAQLNNLTLANDDEYSKIFNAVDFDHIRTVAIEELGMTYAAEDQIVAYERSSFDYVRQVNDMNGE